MRTLRYFLAVLVSLSIISSQVGSVQAARGVPGSQEFGYGARLELDGSNLEDGLAMAADLSLDWLALSIPWSTLPTENINLPAWSRLDHVMQFAGQNHIAVLMSITAPPAAALTKSGPDASMTAVFALALAHRYPQALKAIELFPGANTTEKWGAHPDPQAYAVLYQTVQSKLKGANMPMLLIAGGLTPLPHLQLSEGIDDLTYLKELYQSSAKFSIPVISIQLTNLDGDPLSSVGMSDKPVLRHYEEVRKIMVKMGHEKDLLWITSFSSPSGKMSLPDIFGKEPQNQANWLFQAFMQLRSQLYIGVTVYQSLNPPRISSSSNQSLLLKNQQYHSFYKIYRELIIQNAPGSLLPQSGRPKNEVLDKRKT